VWKNEMTECVEDEVIHLNANSIKKNNKDLCRRAMNRRMEKNT
jgi:hypothetical protein